MPGRSGGGVSVGRLWRYSQPEQPDLSVFAGASGAEGLDNNLVTRGITAWTALLGAVSAEVFEHLGPELPYATTVFDATVALGELLLFGDQRDGSGTR